MEEVNEARLSRTISIIEFAKLINAITDSLPHNPEKALWNHGKIWSEDSDEILCKDKQTATAIADLIDAIYGESITNTGYYDPVEDERNGDVDSRTGYWYVAVQ